MSRQTLSSLLSRTQDSTGKDTSTATQTFIIDRLNDRYEFVKSKLQGYSTEIVRTFSTVASQQYYHQPPGVNRINSMEITIGSVKYPLTPIFSYDEWNRLNAIQIQAGAIPKYYFSRRDDFGIYPIPQDAYTGTVVYTLNAQPLYKTDYTTGTVSTTENSDTVEGASSPAWTSNILVNQWFSLSDSNGKPRGNWYRIESITDADTLVLETVFEEASESGATYIVADSPEIPEDMHILLSYGATADYFAELRQDNAKSTWWENRFWTGDGANSSRDPQNIAGGLINAIQRWEDRDSSQLVQRKKQDSDAIDNKIFATTLSNSS